MDNEAIQQQTGGQPDPRVQLAFERTFLAYERTQIAWVRTALSLISFGFVIAKFFQYLREKQGETATLMSPRAVGLVMITIGLVGLILANWQERRAMKDRNSSDATRLSRAGGYNTDVDDQMWATTQKITTN